MCWSPIGSRGGKGLGPRLSGRAPSVRPGRPSSSRTTSTAERSRCSPLVDGERALPLAPARDYKRLRDGDEGPNTGGMGSFSPVDDLSANLVEQTIVDVVEPVLGTLAADGVRYRGFPLRRDDAHRGRPEGPRVQLPDGGPRGTGHHPQARRGPPRAPAPPVPPVPSPTGRSAGRTRRPSTSSWPPPAIPKLPERGIPITGVDTRRGQGRHPGVPRREPLAPTGNSVTAGGRVLNVVGIGDTVEAARKTAYAAVDGHRVHRNADEDRTSADELKTNSRHGQSTSRKSQVASPEAHGYFWRLASCVLRLS